MNKQYTIDLTPQEYSITALLYQAVVRKTGISAHDITHVEVLRRSLDSRHGRICYHTTVEVYCGEEYAAPDYKGDYQDCHTKKTVIIVGAGPAGLFAALKALELGLKPIILERGKPVDERRRDIAQLARTQSVDPNSNWCFGEGGAGTYSDGKLYTRSNKRGNIQEVLHRFIEHGADPAIKIDARLKTWGADRLPYHRERIAELDGPAFRAHYPEFASYLGGDTAEPRRNVLTRNVFYDVKWAFETVVWADHDYNDTIEGAANFFSEMHDNWKTTLNPGFVDPDDPRAGFVAAPAVLDSIPGFVLPEF